MEKEGKSINKKGQFWSEFGPWIIGIGVLAIVLIAVWLLRGTLGGYGEKILNIIRGGR